MERAIAAAAAGELHLGVVMAVRAVGPAALPPVINLSHPYKPHLSAALVRSSSSSTHYCLEFKPTDQADASQQFQPVVHDDASQGFELLNIHSGITITIGHLQSLMRDPSFFHPIAWPSPARWKVVTVKQAATGDEVPAGVVFANALKSEVLILKIAQFMGDDEVVAAMQGEDDDAGAAERTSTTSTRSTTASHRSSSSSSSTSGYGCLFRCF